MNPNPPSALVAPVVRRVLIVADESAAWRVAGLRQIERLIVMLQEWAAARGALEVCIQWQSATRAGHILRDVPPLPDLVFAASAEEFLRDARPIDLVLSTRLFLHRDALPAVAARCAELETARLDEKVYARHFATAQNGAWQWLESPRQIPPCERRFLRDNGKSQDGMVSRHLNRRVSRFLSRWLLKLPLTPNVWSVCIFTLPLAATVAFLQGTYLGFVTGCAIFQLYSILDGCDGEIARAKFLHSDFGRRLDSFLDLVGNLLLALGIGFGLALQLKGLQLIDWFYISEGVATAGLIILSEGIVFARRTRSPAAELLVTKWNGALYHRHHEMLERSGILVFGERFAFWMVQLTKRDMAMLAFLILALVGYPQGILHLLFTVAAVNSVLARNAFLRPAAPDLATEAS